MKASASSVTACLLLLAVSIAALFAVGPIEKGEVLTFSGVATLALVGVVFVLGAAVFITPFMIMSFFGLGNFTLSGLGNGASDPDEARLQLAEAIKVRRSDGDFTAIPEVYKLYLEGYDTGISFMLFPGSSVTLNGDRAP